MELAKGNRMKFVTTELDESTGEWELSHDDETFNTLVDSVANGKPNADQYAKRVKSSPGQKDLFGGKTTSGPQKDLLSQKPSGDKKWSHEDEKKHPRDESGKFTFLNAGTGEKSKAVHDALDTKHTIDPDMVGMMFNVVHPSQHGDLRKAIDAARPDLSDVTEKHEREHAGLANALPGGKGDKTSEPALPPKELAKGAAVESEHTSDPATAKEIAKDHLTEDTGYYDKLKKMEEKPKTPPSIPGQQRGLFNETPTGQKKLFDFVPPSKGAKKSEPEKSLAESIEPVKQVESLPGQKSLIDSATEALSKAGLHQARKDPEAAVAKADIASGLATVRTVAYNEGVSRKSEQVPKGKSMNTPSIEWTAPSSMHRDFAGKTFSNGVIIRKDASGKMYDAFDTRGELMVDFGPIKRSGVTNDLYVRIADKPELAERVHAVLASVKADRQAKADLLAKNVPGLKELNDAIDNEARYRHSFNKMMDDENNDGSSPPKPVSMSSKEVASEFPRASAYVRAQRMSTASHWAKVKAGKEAMELLASGGSIEDASRIMDNWLKDNDVYVD